MKHILITIAAVVLVGCGLFLFGEIFFRFIGLGRFGDEILFSSMYNDVLKNNFSKIQIECDKRLLEIFKRSFNKKIFVPFGHYSASAKHIQEFDNVIYAGSLTKYFRKTESDFNHKPYIKSLDELDNKFKSILSNFDVKKKIGISCN